jgi:hypothetical protein
MDEQKQKTDNTDEKQTRKPMEKPWLWKPGQSGNPAGRPKGSKNFTTLFRKAVKEVAKKLELGEDPDSVEIEIIKRGIREALDGKYPFYKDIFDRLYGKPTENIDLKSSETTYNFFINIIKDAYQSLNNKQIKDSGSSEENQGESYLVCEADFETKPLGEADRNSDGSKEESGSGS